MASVGGPARQARGAMSLGGAGGGGAGGAQGAILAAAAPYYQPPHPVHHQPQQDVQPDRPIGYGAFGVVWWVTSYIPTVAIAPRDARVPESLIRIFWQQHECTESILPGRYASDLLTLQTDKNFDCTEPCKCDQQYIINHYYNFIMTQWLIPVTLTGTS